MQRFRPLVVRRSANHRREPARWCIHGRIVPCLLLVLAALITVPLLAVENVPIDEIPIEDFDREHWAYRPISRPKIPVVADPSWPNTTIDHFILARLEAKSLAPATKASRETLIRRLTFDLTGLPPTISELEAFVGDQRPGAYTRLVDRLLASPQYGRRWGQYWLDLARFAETDGFEHDKMRPTAWAYRDWVIQSLCDDLPYDEFISLQLAGDILRPGDPDASVATAFCLSGPDMPDINSQEERKHVLMNEITSTVGSVLFSLQMGCAQCHDHKYDAISQADFYRLRAFFDPAVKLKANRSVTTLQPAADPDAVSRLMVRGDWRRPGPEVVADVPRIVRHVEKETTSLDLDQRRPGKGRLQLAKWLTDRQNPLTARTIVNRVWQFHFGRGLSSTPSDFGVMGQEPTHPLLLDHLASRLIDRGWILKDLHRQIVLSSVYKTRSSPNGGEEGVQWQRHDPENTLLARFPRRRLDAESIRDAMLATSGSLNHQAGGPGIRPPLPPELVKTLKSGQWQTSSSEADHYRRSIYIFARRNLRYPLFATFDRPAANCSCAVRHPSTTPVQSLLLLNSRLTLDAAERLAKAVAGETSDRREQCYEVYRRVVSRSPEADEMSDCLAFLDAQSKLLAREGHDESELSALTDLCRALFNSNLFLYVD